ncbi:transcriptional regulator CynR [Robbsia sp. KACC 23696]|uniref:transcriptional regulator CynR n=1 Tax=Robbsia sp. KACC 23696 TaxID=3149231 RepID=UPI00325A5EE6
MLLRHIRYFLAVIEHGSFTRAAEALHVSQPALSQQIRQLEDELGVTLLDRSGKQIVPTDAGAAYAHSARGALDQLESGRRAIQDVADLSRGELRLAFTPTFLGYLAGPLLAAFHSAYPNVRLDVRDMPMQTIETVLLNGEVDVAIAFAPPESPELDCTPLLDETLDVVVGPFHPALRDVGGAEGRPSPIGAPFLDVSALASIPLALLKTGFATRGQIDHFLASLGVTPRVAMESDSVSAIIEAVRFGQLATILPHPFHHRHGLQTLTMRPPMPARTAALIYPRHRQHRAAMRAFIKVAQRVASDLALGEGKSAADARPQLVPTPLRGPDR